MKIVFIHGRSQQGHHPAELLATWTAALQQGFAAAHIPWPAHIDCVLPFYGDRLDRLVDQVDSPLIGNILARGETTVSAQEQFRAEILSQMIREFPHPAVNEAAIAAQFQGTPVERGIQNWKWVQAMLRVLDSTPLGSKAVDLITRDVFVYLTYPGVRKQIDALVAPELNAGPCVVIAHSLGTVVAYNLLCNRPATAGEVPILITLGSPLGLDAVRTRVEAPLRNPPLVKHWFNGRDTQDVVALFPLDTAHFGIAPAIENDSTLKNEIQGKHDIAGYLNKPAVAKACQLVNQY